MSDTKSIQPKIDWNKARAAIDVCTEIEQERLRQINVLGFDAERDDAYRGPTLLRVALIYASRSTHPAEDNIEIPVAWPWPREAWRPGTPRRMLIKAAALIIAEIERLDRAAARTKALREDMGVTEEQA